jgi:hypothetical protein
MSFQSYLDNIELKTGKTPAEFIAEAKEKELTEFQEIIDWLKQDYGLGLGHARAIAELIRHGDKSGTLRLTGLKDKK